MDKSVHTRALSDALSALPARIADSLRAAVGLYGGRCEEIRLCLGGHAYITVQGRVVRSSAVCTEEDIRKSLEALCGHSLYAHSETIREGFLFTETGLRVGVCGRAVCCAGKIELVTDISSLSIRIPSRHIGAADDLYSLVIGHGAPRGMLIWSPPGVGKTTALRELAVRLSTGSTPYRTAVIDTRYELTSGISGSTLDVFLGYPRSEGMEIAVRTMSPQIVICDEIAGEADAAAVRSCAAAGVAVIASAHAGRTDDLREKPELRSLLDSGVFPLLAGLYRQGNTVRHRITDMNGEATACFA